MCRFGFFVFCAMLAGLSVEAHAKDYACNLKVSSSNKGAVPETVFFRVQAGSNEVVVIDPFIKDVFEGPTKGHIEVNNADRIRIGWELPVRFGDNVTSNAQYQLVLNKTSGKARLNVRFIDFLNRYNGRGVCKGK